MQCAKYSNSLLPHHEVHNMLVLLQQDINAAARDQQAAIQHFDWDD